MQTVSGKIAEAVEPEIEESPGPEVNVKDARGADPQRDNFGLYALKCDRNAAKRGLVLNVSYPVKLSASLQRRSSSEIRKAESAINPCEMNHEKYEPVVLRRSREEGGLFLVRAPPRRKRKTLAGSQDTLNAVPMVPSDEELPELATNVKEMCRHFEKQASVDIFTQAQSEPPFEEFDNIFGPSPVAKETKPQMVRRIMEKFSSSESFGSKEEDLQYFKKIRHPIKMEGAEGQVTQSVGEVEKKKMRKQDPSKSKVDKIVFQDKFIPSSYDPPSGPLAATEPRTTEIEEADFERAFPTEPAALESPSDRKTYHDQLTISRHYLNEDVLVWTF